MPETASPHTSSGQSDQPLLMLEGLSKAYPGVQACDQISMKVGRSAIHALLGENGAGKSTLVKMIYGLVRPDEGHMQFDGRRYEPAQPRAARAAGVAMVFQHFSLFEALTVTENILLSLDDAPMKGMSERIRQIAEDYHLALEPGRIVGDLSAGERQRVEIVRCLMQNPKLLIMDEPTSVLTPQEVELLFDTLRRLSGEGTSILYISHKLEEIRALCEDATILRNGKVVANCDPRPSSAQQLAELMVGTEIVRSGGKRPMQDRILLRVQNLSFENTEPFGTSLKSVSFDLHAGEILGIAGIAGNGQDELQRALSGEHPAAEGNCQLEDAELVFASPNRRRTRGLLTAPEQRLGHAASPDMSLTENALLSGSRRMNLAPRGIVDWGKARDFAIQIVEGYDVRTSGEKAAARSLSGGNLQKFLIGREILQNPQVLVVNQPTWGVDAKAAASVRQSLIALADSGSGIVAISQDLDELFEISDRISVLCNGRLSRSMVASETSRAEIGLLMTGSGDAST